MVHDHLRGAVLVGLSAVVWSTGGALARAISLTDGFAVVCLRSLWAAAFLAAFLVLRDGWRGALALVAGMGAPGVAVGLCFATASTCFVLAVALTTVANVLLIQAGVPLLAALIAWAWLGERVAPATWVAIAAVVGGVALMVSDSLTGGGSLAGDGLALLIALALAIATVVTRRYAHVRMTPAVLLGTVVAAAVSGPLATSLAVGLVDLGLLAAFGALNLGLGLALFVTGARLVPAALAALIGTIEPVLGPVWVWALLGEVPSARTLLGGAIILAALTAHLAWAARGADSR